ncbi:MAG: hypothetical protein L0219_19290 [Phycisphaerales bacterium]|nr:hypothetical protein [Phycisphaerales bacterium]MCI0674599.1 hypothetical protein [Phycisphaerales bacterium]
MVDAIVSGDFMERQLAMQTLALTYWPPIYAFLRQRGHRRNEAEELTQAFFSEIVIGRKLFEQADIQRGPLRSLLLIALKRFLIDQHRRNDKPVFRLQMPIEDISHEDQNLQQESALEPDTAFDRRWAIAVLEEALRRCEQHFVSTGKEGHWSAFELRVVKPAISMGSPPAHELIAKELCLGDPADSVAAVRVVRKRLIALFRQVVAETARDPVAQQSEYDDVIEMLC